MKIRIRKLGVRAQRKIDIKIAKRNLEEFFDRIRKLKKGDSIVFDEAAFEYRK